MILVPRSGRKTAYWRPSVLYRVCLQTPPQGRETVKVLLYKHELRFPTISVERQGKASPSTGESGAGRASGQPAHMAESKSAKFSRRPLLK